MKVEGIFRYGFVEISYQAGAPKVKDGKAFVEFACSKKIIKWRRLIWNLADMFCSVLDISLSDPRMKQIKE